MKKAQMSEFIGIVIMIMAIIIFVIFSKISSTNSALSSTFGIAKENQQANLWNGANIMLYTTIDGVTMTELLGKYRCQGNPMIKITENRNINIYEIINITLNNYYGVGRWALELSKEDSNGKVINCADQNGFTDGKCKFNEFTKYITFDFFYPLPCKIGAPDKKEQFGKGTLYVYI